MSATNRGAERKANDFYETPLEAIEALLYSPGVREIMPERVLDPGAGRGAILQVMKKRWTLPRASAIAIENDPNLAVELRTHPFCVVEDDFLTLPAFEDVGVIVCNPPYSLAREFVARGHLRYWRVPQAYLLRLNFLASIKRKDWWQGIKEEPKLRVLSKRPSFTGEGTDATDYAWFCWNWPGGAIEWL